MKVRLVLFLASGLIASIAISTFTSSFVEAQSESQGKTPSAAPVLNTIDGCICRFDELKRSVTIVPWNQDAKSWEPQNAKVFAYQDKTTIEGESKATVSELISGTVIKSFHFMGISQSGFSGRPFEIKSLSQCIGRRATLHWVDDKGSLVAGRIELPYLF